MRRVAFLGPHGTFSEEALLGEADLHDAELVACSTIPEAVALAASGEVDAAFVPFENAIEGSVNLTLDQLVFEVDLRIQREVVLEVHLDLLALAGAAMGDVERVLSFPFATAQCRGFLAEHLGAVELESTNSTAEAAQLLAARQDRRAAAVAPPLTAKLYGLEVLAHAIEDHQGNQTRFVLVAPDGIPEATGHDRTTIVCFQRKDRPGSLYEIIGRFALRNINLTRIESRPTRRGLGDYCFVIEFEGHLDDELVGDCLRELHMGLATLKLLGSYPVPGAAPSRERLRVEADRRRADQWLQGLRTRSRHDH